MAALFAFGGGLMVSAQPYSFTTVDVPAANVTYVDSINNFGQRAGYFIDANGPAWIRRNPPTFQNHRSAVRASRQPLCRNCHQ